MTDVLPISITISFLLILLNKYFSSKGLINLRSGPQRFHTESISRFGGVSIYVSLFLVSFILDGGIKEYDLLRIILLSSLPAFLIGLIDDLDFYVKPKLRLIFISSTPILLFYFAGIEVRFVDIFFIDYLLSYDVLALIFILVAMSAMINGFNIIDGFNGLTLTFSLVLMISLISSGVYSGDLEWITYFVAIFFAVLGVYIFNFPFGKIFLGDAGAYLLGILIPSGLIIYTLDNDLSPWYAMIHLIYPTTEVIFSFFRKIIIQKKSPLHPDGLHFHMLIYKRLTKKLGIKNMLSRHAIVTLIITLINIPNVVIASAFGDNSMALLLGCLNFILFYLTIYYLLLPKLRQ